MMEPITLHKFIHQRVSSLSAALKLLPTGSAIIYTFERPKSLFIGTIPRQAAVLWRYGNAQELQIASSGCTFFTWRHTTELLVVTGLQAFSFPLSSIDVWLIFHVFDPIKFSSAIPVDELHDALEVDVREMFRGREGDSFESKDHQCYQAERFFSLNRKYQKYGFGITRIVPRVRVNHE
jgi:hypothetical protein